VAREGNGKVLERVKDGDHARQGFTDFGNELFTALVALRKAFIWCIGLGEGEEGEGGACKGEEMADVPCERRVWSGAAVHTGADKVGATQTAVESFKTTFFGVEEVQDYERMRAHTALGCQLRLPSLQR
jgi:hypothetical protein